MGTYAEKLAEPARNALGEGASMLAAVRAMADGVQSAQLSGGAAGAMAGVSGIPSIGTSSAGNKMKSAQTKAEALAFPHSPFMAIALTDRRLLVWERGKLFRTLKGLLGDFPVDRIRKVTAVDNKGLGWRITFHLDNNKTVKVDANKRDDPKRFVEQLKALIGKQE